MKNVPFLDLNQQIQRVKDEIFIEINNLVNKNDFIQGSYLDKFENSFSKLYGISHCAGVSSGTSALFLALKASGIQEGDEVITTPATFFATGEAIINCGAKLILCDIDSETYNLDIHSLSFNDKTKAVVPVHLYGQMADMSGLMEKIGMRNIIVIEDAAQAHGAQHKGKSPGFYSNGASYSFYPGKNLGAWGDAGMVVSNDERFIEKIKILRNHGRREKYTHDFVSDNYRMDGIQGAVLSVKLKYIEEWNRQRRQAAELYNELLHDLSLKIDTWIQIPKIDYHSLPVYHIYPIQIKNRNMVLNKMKEKGISCGIHYPVPLHLQPALSFLPYKKGDFPVSESLSDNELSLPIFPEITEEQIHRVVNSLKECIID